MHLPHSFLMNFIASVISVTYWIAKLIAQASKNACKNNCSSGPVSGSIPKSWIFKETFRFHCILWWRLTRIICQPKSNSITKNIAYNWARQKIILLKFIQKLVAPNWGFLLLIRPTLRFDLNLLCDINKFHSWLNRRDYLINSPAAYTNNKQPQQQQHRLSCCGNG